MCGVLCPASILAPLQPHPNPRPPLSIRPTRHPQTQTQLHPPTEVKATKEEMDKAQVDLALRDACAHLLIPLNKCRRATFFLPWKCEDERHGYEACQYAE